MLGGTARFRDLPKPRVLIGGPPGQGPKTGLVLPAAPLALGHIDVALHSLDQEFPVGDQCSLPVFRIHRG